MQLFQRAITVIGVAVTFLLAASVSTGVSAQEAPSFGQPLPQYGWGDDQAEVVELPRIGEEVDVDFFNGDPDRPIVGGGAYGGGYGSGYDLPPQRAFPRNGGSRQQAELPDPSLPDPYEGHRGHYPEQEPTWSKGDQDREDSARGDYYEALNRHADGQASIEAVEDAYARLRRVRR